MKLNAICWVGIILNTGAMGAFAQNNTPDSQSSQLVPPPSATATQWPSGVIPPAQPSTTAPATPSSSADNSVTGLTTPVGSSAPTNFGQITAPPGAAVPPGAATTSAVSTNAAVPGTTAATAPPSPAVTVPAATNTAINSMPNYLQRDQAITPEDQGMLAQMRQAVFPQGPTEPWMSSVHFILKEGVVRVVGTVPSAQERQRIEGVVRQIPGVSRIYDALAVNPSVVASSGAAATNTTPGAAPTPALPPTGYPRTNANGSRIGNPTTTNSVYETVPAQQPR